jgi:hypothetical protein
MIFTILKWIGIGFLILFLLSYLKNIISILLYKFNKGYRDYVDCISAKQLIQEVAERRQLEEQQKQDRLGMLIHQWTQTAQYYYYYYEKGTLMTDYAYMLDLLTQQIIALLGGDYKSFRNQVAELLKDKVVKDGRKQELTDKGISPISKDIKPSDFEKRTLTDDDINKVLDEWERKFKKDKKDDKPEE